MARVLVATDSGLRTFTSNGEGDAEFPGHPVSAIAHESDGSYLSVVDRRDVWRHAAGGEWSRVANVGISLQSTTSVSGNIFAGGMDEAAIVRIAAAGKVERLDGFDHVPGRDEWFAGGPPLGVRGLTATADGKVLLAAVHVGGIPRSTDCGESWAPTIPIMFDVHEVREHPSIPNLVAAATAVGLCISEPRPRLAAVLRRSGDDQFTRRRCS